MTASDQPGLFDSGDDDDDDHLVAAPAGLPEGFKYQPGLISTEEEAQLVRQIETLPFKEFEFHGFLGKRRVVSFGWRYDFGDRELHKVDDVPPFLLPLRGRAAAFAGLGSGDLQHVLVTEYAPGAAIGWHRDKAIFDEVVGISLLSPCRFRLRRRHAGTWQRAALIAQPRSAYLLGGPARREWEHSIPPVDGLRYSITFRKVFARP